MRYCERGGRVSDTYGVDGYVGTIGICVKCTWWVIRVWLDGL